MSDIIYVNKNSYLYNVKPIKHLQSEYSSLLFNCEKNYWLPIDELSSEIYRKISELGNMDRVCDYFCSKYNITRACFTEDTKDFIELLRNKGFIDYQKHDHINMESIRITSGLDDVCTYPFNEIYISLSDACNLNCIYCFNKVRRNVRRNSSTCRELSSEKIKEIIREFKNLNGKDVVFTGGEPSLNKDLIELCEYVHESEMKPHFISNGLLLGKLDLERLVNVVDEFGISLDSVDNELLKKLWDVDIDGLSETIINNLDRIEKICKQKSKTITVKIMPIVSKLNANKIAKIVEKLHNRYRNIRIRWSLTKYDKIGDEIDDYLGISEEEYVDSVIDSLKQLSFNENKIIEYAYSYDSKLKPSHEPQLITCAPSFFVANDGSAYPCQGCESDDMLLGNVWTMSLKELFDTEIFKNIRTKIQKMSAEKCKHCELILCCSTVERPCRDWESENCKEECIKRLFIDAIAN